MAGNGVKACKERLLQDAIAYARDQTEQTKKLLLSSAIQYSRAKKKSADHRDSWKAKRRLQQPLKGG